LKERQYVLPCGRVYFKKSKLVGDLVTTSVKKTILKNRKKTFRFIEKTGRTKQQADLYTRTFYNKFFTVYMKEVVTQLLESNKVYLDENIYLAIGAIERDDYMNWETDGKSYVTKVYGMRTKHRFKMSRKRAKELTKRILNGQKFYS